MYVTAKDGKRSVLPPIRDLAARCRDGADFRELAAELGVAYSTLMARFSAAGFATTGETTQQAQRRELRESRGGQDRPLWMAAGACLDHHPDLWFADPGHAQAMAREICNGCPSRLECLDWAIDTNQQYGIFGGLGREERVNLKRRENYWANRKVAS